MAYRKPPTCQDVLVKASLQLLFMLILVMPMAYIYVLTANYQPFHRGFFCDDQNLKHPYSSQTVPIGLCITIWAVISIVIIVLVESLRSLAEQGRGNPILRSQTPWIAVELYRHFGYFTLGAVSCLLFTEIAKYTIGRLRPHFLTICDPEYTDALCKDSSSQKYERFVIENEMDICRGLIINGGNYTARQLHEARLSFLSGHSSFSFFCGTFLVVYLQSRLSNFPRSKTSWLVSCTYRTLKISRPFLQFGLIILAFWVGLTRISDYFHHPMDVVTGAVVGIIFACVTLVVCADIFNKSSVFWRNVEEYGDPTLNQPENIGSRGEPGARLAEENLEYIDEYPGRSSEKNRNQHSNGSYRECEDIGQGKTKGKNPSQIMQTTM